MSTVLYFQGLPRFIARQQLVKRLTDLGLYRKREDISDSGQSTVLPICSRSGDVIEPVVREQWFVRTERLAEQAIQVRSFFLSMAYLSSHDSTGNNSWKVMHCQQMVNFLCSLIFRLFS